VLGFQLRAVGAPGTVLRADVSGKIHMRAYLTGMPECRFGLNDRLSFEHGAAQM
jgi:AP-2 complex subunit mu-1